MEEQNKFVKRSWSKATSKNVVDKTSFKPPHKAHIWYNYRFLNETDSVYKDYYFHDKNDILNKTLEYTETMFIPAKWDKVSFSQLLEIAWDNDVIPNMFNLKLQKCAKVKGCTKEAFLASLDGFQA